MLQFLTLPKWKTWDSSMFLFESLHCKHSNCEMPCHKYVLWNQMNRCEVVSCRNNIVWIIIIVVLLTIITFIFRKPYFPSFYCHKTILVCFSKKLHVFPQISRHNLTAITAEKKKNCNTPRLAE